MEPCIDKSEKMFVIVPAFNEREVISEVVASIQRVCCDVVVVDDGSRDDTGQRALNAGASLVRHSINLGQGAALQTGIEFALRHGARYIVMLDADGQHDPTEIPMMFDAMRAARADVALGSRFLGHAIGISRSRRFLLHTARMVNFVFTGLKLSDAHNGFRLLTREAASRINLRQPRMAHATEIIAQIARSKLSFIEVPVTICYTDYSVAKGQKMSNSINILIDLILRGLLR